MLFFSLHAKYDCVWNYISLNCKSATTAILLKKIAYLWETLFMMSIRPKKKILGKNLFSLRHHAP